MVDQPFHTVEPESLQKITLNEIITGHPLPAESLDYSVPVPTSNQAIPRRTRDSWMIVQMGSIDPLVGDLSEPGHRGQIGGC